MNINCVFKISQCKYASITIQKKNVEHANLTLIASRFIQYLPQKSHIANTIHQSYSRSVLIMPAPV